MKQKIIQLLQGLGVPYEEEVDLKRKTWIHRGGIAHLYITPQNAKDLEIIAKYLYGENITFYLFGHTSNLYIKNECNIDVVLSTIKCNAVELSDSRIICESGTSVIKLSHQMIEQGVMGFEYLTELPGTVGAALVNNSSCKTNSVSNLLVSARVIFQDGTVKTISPKDFNFQFRSSDFKKGFKKGTILSVTLNRTNGDSEILKQIALENSRDRRNRLGEHAKNLGCTVNKGDSIGKMKWKYSLPLHIIRFMGAITRTDALTINRRINHLLCKMAHCKQVEPYVSPYNPIVFVWEDDGADEVFPAYLNYMREVYKYNSLEIQVIE